MNTELREGTAAHQRMAHQWVPQDITFLFNSIQHSPMKQAKIVQEGISGTEIKDFKIHGRL